jgi:hypothetical protein
VQYARIDLYAGGQLTKKDTFGGKASFSGPSTLVITNSNGKARSFEYDGKIYQTPKGPMIQYSGTPPNGKLFPCDDDKKLEFPNP